jgi:hypothetical protein
VWELRRSALAPALNTRQTNSALFCSELVALIYKRVSSLSLVDHIHPHFTERPVV